MLKKIFVLTLLVSAALFAACNSASNSNTTNKPANAANAANTSNATAPANTAAVETEIKKAVADMADALQKGDSSHFEKLYTDNYMFVGPDGSLATGAERIASMKSGGTKYDSIRYDDVTVRSNAEGNGAVSISRATVKGVNLGKPVDGQYRVTHVWSKTKDGWRLASGQTTPISGVATSPAANTAATANSATPANKTNSNK